MTTSAPSSTPTADQPRMLHRSTQHAVIGGVCAGMGHAFGVPAIVVRVLAVVLTLAGGGAGLVIYLVLWAMLPPDLTEGSVAAPSRRRRLTIHHWLVISGLGLFGTGIALGTDVGWWITNPTYAVPVLAIAAGALVAWYQLDTPTLRVGRGARRWVGIVQVVVGLGLVTFGVVVLVTRGQGLQEVWNGALAAVAVLAGAAGIAMPFGLRLYRGLQREQLARVRETERADIAAHLHDSVLQTLALIQRRADDPVAVQRLARSQERELRAWLYAGESRATDSLAAALSEEVHEVEDEHGVPVEVVVTGDRLIDPAGEMLVKATREAVLNAVRHGRPPVSVYVEAGRHGVDVFVRDHGTGFDLDTIAEDRMGVRESILGRMERVGGSARIRKLDSGTEVELTLPPAQEPEVQPASAKESL